MGRGEVIVTMSAQDAELVRAWQRAKQGPQEVGQELDKLKNKTRETKGVTEQYMTASIGRWVSVAGAIGLAKSALTELIQVHKKWMEDTSGAAVSLDRRFRNYFSQANMLGENTPAQQATKRRIQDITTANAATPEQALAIAEQAVSSGFTSEQVLAPGGILETALQGLAALNAEDSDPKLFMRSITQFLAGTGSKSRKASGMRL